MIIPNPTSKNTTQKQLPTFPPLCRCHSCGGSITCCVLLGAFFSQPFLRVNPSSLVIRMSQEGSKMVVNDLYLETNVFNNGIKYFRVVMSPSGYMYIRVPVKLTKKTSPNCHQSPPKKKPLFSTDPIHPYSWMVIGGTGLWSVVEALEAAVPAPSLVAAVLARQMSMLRTERLANAKVVKLPSAPQVSWYRGWPKTGGGLLGGSSHDL